MKRKPMKPGNPLARKTELKAKSGLKAKSSLKAKGKFAKLRSTPKYDPTEGPAKDLLRERSMGFCEICGNNQADDWHHRQNRSALGLWTGSNGLALCRTHHDMLGGLKPEYFVNGWCVKSWDDPAEEPVLLYDGWALLVDNEVKPRHLTDADLKAIREKKAARGEEAA